MSLTVAVIAQGAMGAGIGHRLHSKGVRVLTLLAGRSQASADRAAAAGMIATDEAEIATADIILSVLPPAEALALAEHLAPYLTAAASKPLYADCNAISPELARRVGAVTSATGCAFVDGGIIGGPPRPDGYTPKLYAAGPRAAKLAELETYGLKVPVLEGPIGAASALKMSYAGFTKGFTAMATATILAATRAGAAEALHAELSASQPVLLTWLDRFIRMMPDKAYRFNGEMAEIAEFIGKDRGESRIYEGADALYTRIAADHAGAGEEVKAVLDFIGMGKAK
jgi:3-hydroxyisobutyrate dehydrogenase-like beta-hydroxyacid dehydrogenase